MNLFPAFFGLFFLFYLLSFIWSISFGWFNSSSYTDDSQQQVFPFYEALYPGVFDGDLAHDVMRGYLPPIHYSLGVLLTHLTGDPIMTGHWIMLIQILGTLVFLFLAVRSQAGIAPAFFAITWFLHTRTILMKLTHGLPRGWAAPLLAAFLWLLLTARHRAILLLIVCSCILYPPSTILICVSYGLYLLWDVVVSPERIKATQRLGALILITPLVAGLAFYMLRRPTEIGQMVTLAEASGMVAFSRPHGRFPFLPFLPWWTEMGNLAYQAFLSPLHFPGQLIAVLVPWVVPSALLVLASIAYRRRADRETFPSVVSTHLTSPVPAPLWFYAGAIIIVYFSARMLAFYLYVPDRHLQIPIALFMIMTCSIGTWRYLYRPVQVSSHNLALQPPVGSAIGLIALAGIIWLCGSHGLRGPCNFVVIRPQERAVFDWLRSNTPPTALIAGHPSYIDPTQLLAARRAFATRETAHPFYPRYFEEMMRRLRISLVGYYAQTEDSFREVFKRERVTHVIVAKSHFSEEKVVSLPRLFTPLDTEVAELIAFPPQQYYLRQVLEKLRVGIDVTFVDYEDEVNFVVNVEKLVK